MPCEDLRVRPAGVRQEAGFTLVELLIAFSLLGLVALMSMGSLQFGARVWDRTSEGNEADARVRAVHQLIRQQLGQALERVPVAKQAQAVQGTRADDKQAPLVGTSDSIVFIAPLPAARDTGSLFQQSLRVSSEGAERRLEMSWRNPEGKEIEPGVATLLTDIAQVNLSYLGKTAGEGDVVWRDRWQEKELPRLIRMQIEFTQNAPSEWPLLVIAPRAIVPH